MKSKYLLAFLFVICAVLATTFYHNRYMVSERDELKELVVLRKIGHDLLNASKDSTSRILPIKKIQSNEYQIDFEKEFAFLPDSLITIIRANIEPSSFPKDFIVNVKNIHTRKTVYSFSISNESSKSIVPCIGRKLPKDNYSISIRFIPNQNYDVYILMIILTIGVLILFLRKSNKRNVETKFQTNTKEAKDDKIQIGNYFFYEKQHCILYREEVIKLTSKESKLLHVFSMFPNQVIDRNTLLKEVWENHGVITTRSLDMFISKLRKKLDKDSSVSIVNVHGLGYKLEITSVE